MQELAEIQREVVHQSRLKSKWHYLERCGNYKIKKNKKKQQQPKKKKKLNTPIKAPNVGLRKLRAL